MNDQSKQPSPVDSVHKSEAMYSSSKDVNREGGLRASLALIGAFFALMTTVGFLNAFGVFQEYYELHQLRDKTAFDISWIGSFSTFVLFAGAVPAGLLVDRLGPLIPMIIGSVFLLLGVFMTSLCTQYYQFFLAQALLMGIGFAFVLIPAVATTPKYFTKNGALAMGVTIAGSSTGGIIWPIMLSNLLNKTTIGFGWSLRIVGFVMMPLLLTACLTVRRPLPPATIPTPSSQHEDDPEKQQTLPTSLSHDSPKVSTTTTTTTIPLIKNRTFHILCFGLGILYLGFFGPFFYVATYALTLSPPIAPSFSLYLVSILNAASFVGRVLPGFFADRYVGTWNLLIMATLASALVAFCWTATTSVAGVIVWCLAYGFASGAIMSLQTSCAVGLAAVGDQGKAVGMVMGSVALTGLFGSPIVGQLVEHYGYLAASMFAGSALVVGAGIIAVARFRLEKRLFAMR